VGTPAAGSVVLVQFPFSDLSSNKLRPAIVVASTGRDDFILCQVTSNPYSDPAAVQLMDADFASGSLKRISYARPGKLFTGSSSLMGGAVGTLMPEAFARVVDKIVEIVRGSPGEAGRR
jgi:mRNA interferase MazF